MSEPARQSTTFAEGEVLQHRDKPHADSATMIRNVIFIRDCGGGFADIGFGIKPDGSRNVLRVPLADLSRQQPAQINPLFAPLRVVSTPSTAPAIPDLAPVRAKLKEAHAKRDEQQRVVDRAAEVVQRAEGARAEADRVLRAAVSRDHYHAMALEDALRAGKPLPPADTDGLPVERAKAAAEMAAEVCERLIDELRTERAKLSALGSKVSDAAERIVAVIGLRESESLKIIEEQVAARRAEIASKSGPRWRSLRERLQASDGDADLDAE